VSMSEETRTMFEDVLDEVEGLPATDRAEVGFLLEHNEPVIAFETLVTQTYEWALPVPASTFEKLEVLARRLGVGDDLLSVIRDELVG
jgi:hypothetical protein